MKRDLTVDDIQAAVLGGAILGGGGGGFVDAGLQEAQLALQVGTPQLWSVDEFDPQDMTATVALVGAPAAPHPFCSRATTCARLSCCSRTCRKAKGWRRSTPMKTARKPRSTAGFIPPSAACR